MIKAQLFCTIIIYESREIFFTEVNLMLNDLNIRIFLSLGETLNFTEVGRRMFISQQAVSKHIAQMEDDLDTKLFVRSRNRVELTTDGIKYYSFFREMVDRMDELRSAKPEKSNVRRTLHIGYQNWLDYGPGLNCAMDELRKTYPEVDQLAEMQNPKKLIQLLDNDSFDMILIFKRFLPVSEGFQKLALITAPMQLVVSKSFAMPDEDLDPYEYYKDFPVLIDCFKGEKDDEAILRCRRECRNYKFSPARVIPLPNRDSVSASAEIGTGIFFSSAMAMNSNTLARYDSQGSDTLYCVWKDHEDSDVLEKYARALQKEYKKRTESFLKNRSWN